MAEASNTRDRQAAPAMQPLYAQVKELLRQRIQSGAWRPGQPIPSEFALADELGVSQGTVRKALGELTADNLLVRRQGRGTFVAQHTPETTLFRFFHLYDADGTRIAPETAWSKAKTATANAAEREQLELEQGATVIRISRVRTHEGRPFVCELITVPRVLFPGLAEAREIPNTLYDHFQRDYGVTVIGGEEKVDAVLARAREAGWLDIDVGAPLLRLDRLTYSFENRPVEWRVSHCALSGARYCVKLG